MAKVSQSQISSAKARKNKVKPGGNVPANGAVFTKPQGKKGYECPSECRMGTMARPLRFLDEQGHLTNEPEGPEGKVREAVVNYVPFCRTHMTGLNACIAAGYL